MFKLFNFFIFCFLCGISLQALSQAKGVDDVNITFDNVKQNKIKIATDYPVASTSTKEKSNNNKVDNSVNNKVPITVTFLINDPSNLKEMNLLIGSQKGKSDYRMLRIKCVKQIRGYFLTYGDIVIPIIDKKAIMNDMIASIAQSNDLHVTLLPLDLNKKSMLSYSKTIAKKI